MNYFDGNQIYRLTSNKNIVALFLFLVVLLFKLPIINMPYHWDELSVIDRAFWIYRHKLNCIGGPSDVGHPPLVYEILAVVWSIFGYSIWITHLVNIIFSFVGVYFTYLLGTELKDEKVGIIAALLLFLSPLYYTQSGILNLDMPLTAFIVMSIYFILKENTKLYLISSMCLVMIKAPGLLLIISILIYILFKDYKKPKKILFKRLVIYSFPLFFFLGWIAYHKWQAGWFLYPWVFTYQIGEIAVYLNQRIKIFFSKNYNFLLSVCMVYYIFFRKWQNRSKKLLYQFLLLGLFAFLIKNLFMTANGSFLFLVLYIIFLIQIASKKREYLPLFLFILICLITFSSFIGFLPRYLLIAYPFYYITGTYCLVEIFRNRSRITTVVVIILLFLSVNNWYGHRKIDSPSSGALLESNLEYMDIVRTHKLASKFIEENYPQSIVLTSWPQILELSKPFLGYVTTPIKCVYFSRIKKGLDPEINLIYYSDQSDEAFEMQKLMDTLNIRLLKSFEYNGKYAAIYKIIRN